MAETLALINYEDLKKVLEDMLPTVLPVIKNETWDTSKAAAFLDISIPTLKKYAADGTIPGVKIGTDWKFNSIALYKLTTNEKGDHNEKTTS